MYKSMSYELQTLIQQLDSNHPTDQCAAAEALARMGKDAQPAAAALVAALRTADTPTREWCAAALEELGPPSTSHIRELAELAGDESLDAAYWAITLLGRANSDAGLAVPALIKTLQYSSELALRERAAWALGKLGPAAKSAAASLQEAAASGEPRLARLAKQALAKIES
jgi:HEAT repeat protein